MRACLGYSLLLALLGVALCGAAAAASAWARAGIAWCGAAALLLSVMYLAKDRGGAPERALQALPAVPGLVFLPYTLFGLAVLLLSRALTREPLAQEIAERVWLGGAPLPWDRGPLRAHGVDCVLNLCLEFADPGGFRRAGVPYRRVPILDGAPPHPSQLREAVEWAALQHVQGRAVFVHCAQGHGRSATAAAALLVRLGLAPDPAVAQARIKTVRPRIRIAARQFAVVEAYCRELRSDAR